jgi:hypothetical protein
MNEKYESLITLFFILFCLFAIYVFFLFVVAFSLGDFPLKLVAGILCRYPIATLLPVSCAGSGVFVLLNWLVVCRAALATGFRLPNERDVSLVRRPCVALKIVTL